MSATILAGSNACRVCSIRSFGNGTNIFAAARPWCRQVTTTIARTPLTHSELTSKSGRVYCRSVASKAFPNPSRNSNGKDPSKRRIAVAMFAAIASGVCFDRLGTIENSDTDDDDRKFLAIRGPMVAHMTKRRNTSFQLKFGDSILVDHVESSKTIAGENDDQIDLLLPEDAEFISPFLFYLMTCVELVRVQEGENQEYNLPIGLPGLGCAYCSCSAEFPLDRRTLPNKVRKHLYNHIRRCQRCPLEVKLELKRLHKLEKGTRISREERLFFRELWFRMGHKAVI